MRVFISHGIAADDARGNAFLDRLYAALDRHADNLDPFLDRIRLAPGYLWRNELHTELARCGAGVIVLSARSVTRDWVKKEAAILSWRRALEVDPAFRLHVVVLGELGEAELERAGLGPMQLTEIQALRCDGSDAGIAQVVDAARDDLLALAKSVARRVDWTPLDWLRDYLASRLAKDLTAAQLLALAQDIDDRNGDDSEPALQLANVALVAAAEAIACALLRNAFGKTANLAGLMKRLDMLAVQREYRREIFDAVSALWVDPQCAAPFHPRLDPKRRGRTAYIALLQPGAGAPLFETRMLAQRANPDCKRSHVVSVAKPKDPNRLTRAVADELAEQFADALRDLIDDDDDEGETNADHSALLRQLARLDAPVYVVMKFALDEQQLEELFAKLPGFIYVGPDAERPAGFTEFQWRRVSGWRQPDELSARKDEHANIKTQYGF